MNRYSIVYLLEEQYYQLSAPTVAEADALLHQIWAEQRGVPIGIYDAKTELFQWEPNRQRMYDQLSIEEQARYDQTIVAQVQELRRQTDEAAHNQTTRQPVA